MAINPETQYPGKINPSDADYPFGSARNISTPGDGTGTPWEAALVNDVFGMQQALLSFAGLTPSGNPDKVGASQYLRALKMLASRGYASVSALDGDADLAVGDVVHTTDYYDGWAGLATPRRGGNVYVIVAAATGTADGGAYIDLTASGLQAKALFIGGANVMQWGARGDGTTDDHPPLSAAVAWFNSVTATAQAVLEFPANKYRITDALDFSQAGGERRQVLGGAGFEVAEIIVDFNGYGTGAVAEGAFIFGDEASPAYQTSVDLSGFQFTKGPSCDRAPVGVIGILAQSRLSNIIFGSWNNSLYRFVSFQNNRCENLTSFSGGKAWEYKDASSVTVTQSGTTLTASGAIFDVNDVGHTIGVWGTGSSTLRRKMKITSFTSATEVEVDTEFTDGAARELYFAGPLVSITSGNSTLTADASTFTANDVGLVVYVKGAGADGRLLRTTISAFISATQVTLADTAGTTVNDVEFTTPAVDMYSGAVGGASDNTFVNFQIENHVGVGLCMVDQDNLRFVACKVHGEQSATSDRYSIAPVWLEQCEGYYQGSFDAQYLGEEKVYAVWQTACFNFETLTIRTAYDEIILKVDARATGFEGGIIQLDDVTLGGGNPNNADLENLIIDANSDPAGHVLTGKVSWNEFDKTVSYNARNPGSGDQFFTSEVSWNGTAPTGGSERYKWSRVGDLVFFDFRLDYSSAGSSNSNVDIDFPPGMPIPKVFPENIDGEIIKAVDGLMSTNNDGSSPPGLNKEAYIRRDGAGGYTVRVTLNSGSIAAQFASVSGFYQTEV